MYPGKPLRLHNGRYICVNRYNLTFHSFQSVSCLFIQSVLIYSLGSIFQPTEGKLCECTASKTVMCKCIKGFENNHDECISKYLTSYNTFSAL